MTFPCHRCKTDTAGRPMYLDNHKVMGVALRVCVDCAPQWKREMWALLMRTL